MPARLQPPSAYKPPPPADSVGRLRLQYLQSTKSKSPSSLGQPKEFARQQKDPAKTIYCDRPPDATDTIPVTLLHPVFGQFLDDIDTYEPTSEDNSLALDLSKKMSNIYPDEDRRGTAIRDALYKMGITLVGTTIEASKYRTDGDLQHNRHRYVIAELKNEVGSLGAEPNAQALVYYLESTRNLAVQCAKSPLPCFLLYIFGMAIRLSLIHC